MTGPVVPRDVGFGPWPGGEFGEEFGALVQRIAHPEFAITTEHVRRATGVRVGPGMRVDWARHEDRVYVQVFSQSGAPAGPVGVLTVDTLTKG